MAEKIEQRSVSVRIDGKDVENSLRKIQKATNDLYNETAKLPKGTDEYKKKLAELNRSQDILRDHKREVNGIKEAWYKNTTAVKGLVAAAAGMFAVDQVIYYSKQVLSLANNFEQTSVAFETMLGSKQKADKLQRDLIELAAKTPFELTQVQDSTKQLLAYGFAAEEIIGQLRLLGDIASGVGIDKLPQITLAYGQVKAATRLMGQELNQFTQNGIPLLEELSKVMSKTPTEVKKMVEEGKVGFPLVQKALQNLTGEGGRFQNMMAKQAETLGGVFSTFKDNITQQVLLPLGQSLADMFKPGLKAANDFFKSQLDLSRDALTQQQDKVRNMEASINPLLDTYAKLFAKTKLSKEEQNKLNETIDKIGEVAPTSVLAVNEYGKAIKINVDAVRELMSVEQAHLKFLQRDVIAQTKEQIKQLEFNLTLNQKLLDQVLSGDMDKFNKDARNKIGYLQNAVGGYQDMLKGARAELDRLEGKTTAVTGSTSTTSNTSTTDPKDIEKRAEKVASAREKLAEQLVGLETDLAQIPLKGLEKTESTIKEKYDKERRELQKLAKEFPELRGLINRIEMQLVKNQTAEITNIYEAELIKLRDGIEKHLEETNALRLSDDERKIQAVYDSYDKEIQAAKELGAKGIVEYTALVRLRDEAVARTEMELRAQRQQTELAESLKFLEERQKQREDFEKKIQEELVKPNEDPGRSTPESTPQYLERLKSAQQLEIEALRLHFDEMLRLADDFGVDSADLKEKQKQREAAIDLKYQGLAQKRERDDSTEKIKAYGRLYGELGNLAVSFGQLIGSEGERNTEFQKVMTLAQIAFDTAAAISSLTRNSEANPANAVTAGIAGTIQFVTGLARIIANIAKAKQVLTTAPPVKQKYDGGYMSVIGEQDGQQYNAAYSGVAHSGAVNKPTLFLTGERGAEYVIANPELRHPAVANFLPVLEAIRQKRVRGYANGGEVTLDRNNPQSPTPTPQSPILGGVADERAINLLQLIYEALVGGKVIALVTTEGAFELTRLQNKAVEIAGYNPR